MPDNIKNIQNELSKVIVGKKEITDKILMAILARGHVLLEDVPGVGKTTTALGLSKILGLDFRRIQFTPDVVPSDVTGFTMYDKETGEFRYRPGAVMCNMLLADEINRTSSKTQSALLEVMEEGNVTVDGVTYKVPEPFVVIATQNPLGTAGTQMLPESQLDRFMVRLSMGYPDIKSQVELLRDRRKQNPMEQVHQILDGEQIVAAIEKISEKRIVSKSNGQEQKAVFLLEIPDVKRWSPDSPHLYTLNAAFGNDQVTEHFGVRTLHWNEREGMTINGKRVILRGACVHHDNGLLGACTFPEAEERKVRILKENGYNAIRSSHYPCSRAFLDACDRQGMLMMDEYVDVWYIHKTKYDYATELKDWWKQDFNHPSVIMYSTGNEVAETAQKKGIAFTRCMTEYLHSLDGTRPVTCGINIFFNFLSSMGLGVYSDKKADQTAKDVKKKKSVGSEFFNELAGVLGADFMKTGATTSREGGSVSYHQSCSLPSLNMTLGK